jgi:hypothetical protein
MAENPFILVVSGLMLTLSLIGLLLRVESIAYQLKKTLLVPEWARRGIDKERVGGL